MSDINPIDQACAEATERLKRFIENSAKKHSKALFRAAYPVVKGNVPLGEVQSSVVLSIHTEEQFYKCVNWCNNRIGKGSEFWTVRGRVLRFIAPWKPKTYNPPAAKEWVCFVPGVDITPLIAFIKS